MAEEEKKNAADDGSLDEVLGLYDKCDYVLKVILTVIPFTCWLIGGIFRILRGLKKGDMVELVFGIVYLLTGAYAGIGWVLDIITVLTKKDIYVVLDSIK